MTKTHAALLALLIVTVFASGLLLAISLNSHAASASVSQSNEYLSATTTPALGSVVRTLKTGFGSIAQVTITASSTGFAQFYDATTSDITKRGNIATSSLFLIEIPVSTAPGTYTFDALFTRGLLMVTSGSPATSTITYR